MLAARNNIEIPPALPGFEDIGRYWDPVHNCHAAKILPGEYYVTRNDEAIVTVLGSCISACISDRKNGVGGMNHFMLPNDSGSGLGHWHAADLSASTRYGNVAMEHLINSILKNGGRRENLEVKIFGGGRIIQSASGVGQRNIAFINDYINTEGLSLVSQDVADIYPRKVMFYLPEGRARVKKLRSLHNDTIATRETNYMNELEQQPVSGEVELF